MNILISESSLRIIKYKWIMKNKRNQSIKATPINLAIIRILEVAFNSLPLISFYEDIFFLI